MKYEESKIQIAFFDWIKLQYPKFAAFCLHIPNGGKMGIARGRILKRMGVKAGTADVLFMWRKKYFGGLWLEFKSATGKQSESQKEFERLCHIAQYDYQVVHSVDEAMEAFKRYMSLEEEDIY